MERRDIRRNVRSRVNVGWFCLDLVRIDTLFTGQVDRDGWVELRE